ncbi:MAG: hypothetical protein JXB20_04190 [Bacilli bacterium]|nr:hypothetical protein [Bacilli bacterium]MBN2696635.1 hypothetical protein [Bacilli bacterium]
MNKVLVLLDDGLLSLRINRLLGGKGIDFEIRKSPIRSEEVKVYSLLVVHSSYKITDLAGFLENIIVSKVVPVIFISMNPHAGCVPRLNQKPGFVFVDESKLDVELPLAIQIQIKQRLETERLLSENRKLKLKADKEKILFSCKQKLIEQGMTEPEAHKYVLKRAMDAKVTKYDIAAKILQEIQ